MNTKSRTTLTILFSLRGAAVVHFVVTACGGTGPVQAQTAPACSSWQVATVLVATGDWTTPERPDALRLRMGGSRSTRSPTAMVTIRRACFSASESASSSSC